MNISLLFVVLHAALQRGHTQLTHLSFHHVNVNEGRECVSLGVSLSYYMVVNGHGGSIQFNSVEGEGSEFIITLPSLYEA